MDAYTIDGCNYFEFRELSRIIDLRLDWDSEKNCFALNSNDIYQTGELWETVQNNRMTVVRGLRINGCEVSAMKKLYGEPTSVLKDGAIWGQAENKDVKFGELEYYVYAGDYKNLLVAYVVDNIVVGVYTNTNENITGGKKFYDEIGKVNYATLVTNFSRFGYEPYIYPYNWETQQKLCFYSTNALRAKSNLYTFNYSEKATEASNKYAVLMAKKNHYSHNGPDGSSIVGRMKAQGINSNIYGENIARMNYSEMDLDGSGFEFTRIWYNSSGHRKNMLSSAYKNLGVGIAPDLDRITLIGYNLYAVQNFH